jgi:ABC-type xylose transport system permease subunit
MTLPLLLAHGGWEIVVLAFVWLIVVNSLGIVSCVAAWKMKRLVALSTGAVGATLGVGLLRAYRYRAPDSIDSFLVWFGVMLAFSGICIALIPQRNVS